MSHVYPVATKNTCRIVENCALIKSNIDVLREYVDVDERRIPDTRNRASVVDEFSNVVATTPCAIEPSSGDGSERFWFIIEPLLHRRMVNLRVIDPKDPNF